MIRKTLIFYYKLYNACEGANIAMVPSANPLLPIIKHDLMQLAIRYHMPYYEVHEVYIQLKDYVEKKHPDFDTTLQHSYIMKLTESNIKKIAISKGRYDDKPSNPY